MSYSRRQLYAMGEPIGDSATYRKTDGGLILGGGGGGGSSSQQADTTNTSMTELPEWARGYAKDTLYQASQLTDINKNPYQQYTQPRIAGFTPMQQTAQQNAANMRPNAALGVGMDMAARAGSQSFANDNTAANFMSPYMQNVVDVQKREAQRQSGIQGTQQQAQAAQAGAFGGGRDAIMRAERERNLGTQMNDIQAMGSQNAFQNAQQQFNAENQTGLQAAGQLGALGQAQYGQQMGINQLQNQYGGQQQAFNQQGLSQGYQDFINQQNNPYKQLGFMSDLVRGMPLGQQSTSQIYQAPPSMMQNIGAAGMGLYGAKQLNMFAEGGQVKGYAGGGELNPMDDLNRMTAAVSKLSDEQLQQVIQRPSSAAQKQAAQLELATRRSEKQGLASAYNMLPAGAGGGMVAFGKGGIMHFLEGGETNINPVDPFAVDRDYAETDDELDNIESGGVGDTALHHRAVEKGLGAIDAISALRPPTAVGINDPKLGAKSYMETMRGLAGPDPYADATAQVSDIAEKSKTALEQGKGIAALSAMGAILQGPNFMRALGGAGAAFADSYKGALAANQVAAAEAAKMKINIATGKRAETLGLAKDAISSFQSARANETAMYKAQSEALRNTATAAARLANATKAPRPAAAVRPSAQAEGVAIYAKSLMAKDKTLTQDEANAQALEKYNQQKAAGLPGVTAAVEGRTVVAGGAQSIDVDKLKADAAEKAAVNVDKRLLLNPEYREAMRGKDPKGRTAEQVRGALVEAETQRILKDTQLAPVAPPTPAAPKAAGVTTAPPIDLLKEGTVTTFKNGQKWTIKAGKPVQVN
jgi:hypothetical protein